MPFLQNEKARAQAELQKADAELASLVEHEIAEFPTFGTAFPGTVRIVTTAGETLIAELPYQRGGEQNPMSEQEERRKFDENAALSLPDDAVEALGDAILGLERLESLRGTFAVLGKATRSPTSSVVSAWSS